MRFLFIQVLLLSILALLNANPIDTDGEYGDKYQGDIVLTPEQEQQLNNGRSGRTGILNLNARWPKTNGRAKVPYVISSIYTSYQRNLILNAMSTISSKTCIDFVPRTTQYDYLNIYSDSGCWSYVGKIGGKQNLSLKTSGCMVVGIAMHELIHALGYEHMHQHWDRDSKVKILFENISSGNEQWFKKFDSRYYNNYGTPYDIESVMHYGQYAFSKNGRTTIQALNPNDYYKMGQRSYLSSGDVTRLRNLYQC